MRYLLLIVLLLGACTTEKVATSWQCDKARLARLSVETGIELSCASDGTTVLLK